MTKILGGTVLNLVIQTIRCLGLVHP